MEGFVHRGDGYTVGLFVPDAAQLRCYLRRCLDAVDDDDDDDDWDNNGWHGFGEDDHDLSNPVEELLAALDDELEAATSELWIDPTGLVVDADELMAALEGDSDDVEVHAQLLNVAAWFDVARWSATWWYQPESDHGPECTCGPRPFVQVLQSDVGVDDRQGALNAHLDALRTTWDHYWSGDAALTGSSETLGGVCALCLGLGRAHVGDVGGDAHALADELGQALAAFNGEVALGADRYLPGELA
jgi:hypothetical protein